MAQVFDEEILAWNLHQQIYCHNAAANVVGQLSGTRDDLQAEAEKKLAKHVPEIPGSWKVAWGPAVYKADPDNKSTGATNAWYGAVSEASKTCVLAVAGTARTSLIAWWGDIHVKDTVLFDDWAQNWKAEGIPDPDNTFASGNDPRSFCSRGTANFVRNILNMQSPNSAVGAGTKTGTFLQNMQKSGYNIVFTGHSLGGAVSPALAHGLVQAKILTAKGVNVLPSAGASPGNAAWNHAFSQNFTESGSFYPPFNRLLFNHLDIVPQAWSAKATDDRNIPNINQKIYTKLPNELRKVLAAFVWIGLNLARFGMNYAPLQGSAFTGDPIPSNISTPNQLLLQWGKQHSPEYWKKIGIQSFVDKLVADKLRHGVKPLPNAPDFQDPESGEEESSEGSDDALQQLINEMETQLRSHEGKATSAGD